VAEVFAGIICGYVLALVATPFAALLLIRLRVESEWLRRIVPPKTPLFAWSFVMHTFWFMAFTGVGILFGLLLHGLENDRPAGGLGSPNVTFTFVVLAISSIAVLPMAVAVARWRTALLIGGFVFAAMFGWVMPYLSLLGPERS
jgi:hypothetical protein